MDLPIGKAHIAIVKKNDKKYYYVEWSVRKKIDKRNAGKTKGSGKSKVINNRKYLGTETTVLENILSKKSPQKAYSIEFGLPMSILTIAKEIGLFEIIDDVIPCKVNGIKTSEYILISAISKLSGSISKDKTGDYFNSTVLPEVMGIRANKLHSKSYWAIFEKIISEKELKAKKVNKGKKFNDKLTIEELEELIDDSKLEEIEERLWSNLIKKYNILLDILLYDGTNSFTYYQDHTRNSYGQKGRNKKGRHNLRQIGLFIAVTGNGFPFISQLACGNLHDATLFPIAMKKLIKRYHQVMEEAKKIKLSFDKGNNSQKNIKAISQTEYVGSVPPSSHTDLTSISLKQYTKRYKECPVYECEKAIFGSTHKIFITYNKDLKEKQANSFSKQYKRVKLMLQEKFNNHRKIDVRKLNEEIKIILQAERILSDSASKYLKCKIKDNGLLITVNKKEKSSKYQVDKKRIIKILEEKLEAHKNKQETELDNSLNYILNSQKIIHSKGCRYLSYEIKNKELLIKENADEIKNKEALFGKNIIFTNNLKADHIEAIGSYKEKYKVEGAFDNLKDHRGISFHPFWHWTDTKIRIDSFISVLSYLLIRLLQHLADEEGLKMSTTSLITALKGVREVVMVYPDKTAERLIEEIPEFQERLLKKYGVIT